MVAVAAAVVAIETAAEMKCPYNICTIRFSGFMLYGTFVQMNFAEHVWLSFPLLSNDDALCVFSVSMPTLSDIDSIFLSLLCHWLELHPSTLFHWLWPCRNPSSSSTQIIVSSLSTKFVSFLVIATESWMNNAQTSELNCSMVVSILYFLLPTIRVRSGGGVCACVSRQCESFILWLS